MEWLGSLRSHVWHNAGFGSLRNAREHFEECEPLFEPTVVPFPDAGPDPDPDPDRGGDGEVERRAVLSSSALSSEYPQSRYYSVVDYHEAYLAGELTPTEVAAAILPLIRKDTTPQGEYSSAWFDTKADLVMRAAEASTLRYKNKCPLGVLDGVPTAVKDEYELDGYSTNLGSRNDYTSAPVKGRSRASWCVQKLEEAGCVVLGKLHMVEFGIDTPGNNPNHGTPRNPYNRDYYTGGSSSGSAYAVAAGLVPFALGSDGGGSIRIPASFCSVFGLKPTHGRLSFRPGPNHCVTCACLGPLAGDVCSLAAVLEVIGQPCAPSPFPPVPSVARLLAPSPSRPKILGVPEAWVARSTPGIQQLFGNMVKALVHSHGYAVVPVAIPLLPEGQIAHAMTVLNDAATLLPETRNLSYTSRILLAIGRTTPATDYTLAQKLRRLLVQHVAHLFRQHPGMLIVTPTTSCAGWRIRGEGELRWGLSDGDTTVKTMEYVWLANFCGLPSLSVPMEYVVPEGRAGAGAAAGPETAGKVPVGFMATGEWAGEAELLQFGLEAEEAAAASRARPPIWVDVLERAKAQKTSR